MAWNGQEATAEPGSKVDVQSGRDFDRVAIFSSLALLAIFGAASWCLLPPDEPPDVPLTPPAPRDMVAASIYVTRLATQVLQLIADLRTPRAAPLLLHSALCFIAGAPHVLACSGRYPPPNPLTTLSWALSIPTLSLLLASVSTAGWRVATGATALALAALGLGLAAAHTPAGAATAVPVVAAAAAAIAAAVCVAVLVARLGTFMHRSADRSRLAVVWLLGGGCVAALLAATAVWTASWRSSAAADAVTGWMHVFDSVLRGGLGQVATVAHCAKIDIRQREVMRAIEASSSYKSATDMKAMMEQKDCFMASVSHELRTPLNGIIGLTEGLLKGTYGPLSDAMRRQLHIVRMSGLRLLAMINGIMDSSALRMKRLNIREEPVNVHATCDDVMELTRHLTKAAVAIVNAVPRGCVVRGDSDRLVQIFNNLLGNAAKFTKAGEIRISAQREEGGALWAVSVSDTGIGIPADKLGTIFDAFEQVDMSIARNYGGFGLGLNIVRDLVRAHGGTVSVRSTVDVGSTFTFTLPVAEGSGGAAGGAGRGGERAGSRPKPRRHDSRSALGRQDKGGSARPSTLADVSASGTAATRTAFPLSLRITGSHLNTSSRTNPLAGGAAPPPQTVSPTPPPRHGAAAAASSSPRGRSRRPSADRTHQPAGPLPQALDGLSGLQQPLPAMPGPRPGNGHARRGSVAARFKHSVRMHHDGALGGSMSSTGLESMHGDEAYTAPQHAKAL